MFQMGEIEAMVARHSVRSYTDRPIEPEKAAVLMETIHSYNAETGMSFQLVLDEPRAFTGMLAHYGKFENVRNYIAIVGPKDREVDAGYFGEKLVILAQRIGLNTCWVAVTFNKRKARIDIKPGEKLYCVISLGYGTTQGVQHQRKPMESLCRTDVPMPKWFRNGMECAMLAPTAINQQKYFIELREGVVDARKTGGIYSDLDLGIVRYHFETGAGKENFTWYSR